MEVKFMEYHVAQSPGFTVLNEAGEQVEAVHHCKEVFARRMKTMKNNKRTLSFLRLEATKKSKKVAGQQEAVLHVFEKAMGIEPAATVEPISNTRSISHYDYANCRYVPAGNVTEHFLLYTVSKSWRRHFPLSHILALIVRNYYPEGEKMDWRSILKWLNDQKIIEKEVKLVAGEIIRNKGKLPERRIWNNGIDDYARGLMRRRERRRWR